MEHRNGIRVPVSMDVELWRGGRKCGSYKSSNVGQGGLFLTCPEEDIGVGGLLVVKLMAPNPDVAQKCGVKAMVVHKSGRGVGLMWADYNEAFSTAMAEMLTSAALKSTEASFLAA